MLLIFGNVVAAVTTSLRKLVSLSSREADYVTISDAVKIIACLRYILEELRFPQQSTRDHQDNSGCMELKIRAIGKHFKKRFHIGVRCNSTTQFVRNGSITVIPTRMTEMIGHFQPETFYVENSRRQSQPQSYLKLVRKYWFNCLDTK